MPRFRTLAALALSLLLACSSLALAEPRGAGPLRVEAPETGLLADTFSRLWDWLTAGWTKEGCGIDPDGQCTQGNGVPAGCGSDPDGVCVEGAGAASTKAGCGSDPSGSPCTGDP